MGEQDHRFWRTEIFEVADLIDYLDGKSVIQIQHDAMVPTTRIVDFGGRKLSLAQFAMDLENAARLIDETFVLIPDNGEPPDTPTENAMTPIVLI